MIDNILISLSFVFLARNINSNEINDLTFKSDRLLAACFSGSLVTSVIAPSRPRCACSDAPAIRPSAAAPRAALQGLYATSFLQGKSAFDRAHFASSRIIGPDRHVRCPPHTKRKSLAPKHRVVAIADADYAVCPRLHRVNAIAQRNRIIRSRDRPIIAVPRTDGLVLQKAPVEKHGAVSGRKPLPGRSGYVGLASLRNRFNFRPAVTVADGNECR